MYMASEEKENNYSVHALHFIIYVYYITKVHCHCGSDPVVNLGDVEPVIVLRYEHPSTAGWCPLVERRVLLAVRIICHIAFNRCLI